jgi:hypothetical protein
MPQIAKSFFPAPKCKLLIDMHLSIFSQSQPNPAKHNYYTFCYHPQQKCAQVPQKHRRLFTRSFYDFFQIVRDGNKKALNIHQVNE